MQKHRRVNSKRLPLKIGDVIENGWWLDGTETADDLMAITEQVGTTIRATADNEGMIIAAIRAYILKPGDERCPPVPDHTSGPDVRLLMYEATVVAFSPYISLPGSFSEALDKIDRERLRQITRMAHQKKNPRAKPLTDGECDKTIDAVGPESAMRALKAAVDSRTVH